MNQITSNLCRAYIEEVVKPCWLRYESRGNTLWVRFPMNAQHQIVTSPVQKVLPKAISWTRDIARASAVYRRATGQRKLSLRAGITRKIDQLLEMLLVEFPGSVSAREADVLLADRHALAYHNLSALPRGAVPLVLMRQLIAVHQTPIERLKLRHWSEFARRYANAIV